MFKSKDFTLRVFVISTLLTILLAISNTYLALKVGLLTAASIPAAILSMGLMKFMRKSTVFEHNLVQTAASSGEAVAGGIVYTIPALIVIGFWDHFPYFENVLIALLSGFLGVFFSSLIRRPLLSDRNLRFPEGQAITEVLRLKEAQVIGFKEMLGGGLVAAVIEFAQSTNLALSGMSKFIIKTGMLFGAGISIAPALIGAGFIIGARVGLSLLLGVVLSYGVLLPLLSHGHPLEGMAPQVLFAQDFSSSLRYVGIGAMLLAALLTLISLLKPLFTQIIKTLYELLQEPLFAEHDRDLSKQTVFLGSVLCLIIFYPLLDHLYGLSQLGISHRMIVAFLLGSIAYIFVIGFIFAVVCGYFSGLVGVSASPGSSVIIAGMIFAALLIRAAFSFHFGSLSAAMLQHGEAMTIIVGGIITGIACIANDTLQDLKVGQFLKASPRKQQLMLLFGVVIASLVIPLVMDILYRAYGFVGHMPRPDMDANQALAIPPAAMMAALTQGVFNGDVPWHEMGIGALAMAILGVLNLLLKRKRWDLSLLGIGIGMYLPLSSSSALIVGSLLALLLQWRLRGRALEFRHILAQKKLLLACGLVTGATVMDVLLAVPVALNPQGAALSFQISPSLALGLGGLAAALLLLMMAGFNSK